MNCRMENIHRTAIREICVSWHYGAQFRASRKAIEHQGSMVQRDLRLSLICYPILPRDGGLPDSRCSFSECGHTPIEGITELIYLYHYEGIMERFEFNIISPV